VPPQPQLNASQVSCSLKPKQDSVLLSDPPSEPPNHPPDPLEEPESPPRSLTRDHLCLLVCSQTLTARPGPVPEQQPWPPRRPQQWWPKPIPRTRCRQTTGANFMSASDQLQVKFVLTGVQAPFWDVQYAHLDEAAASKEQRWSGWPTIRRVHLMHTIRNAADSAPGAVGTVISAQSSALVQHQPWKSSVYLLKLLWLWCYCYKNLWYLSALSIVSIVIRSLPNLLL
jgi:hypothetical protein